MNVPISFENLFNLLSSALPYGDVNIPTIHPSMQPDKQIKYVKGYTFCSGPILYAININAILNNIAEITVIINL